MKLLVQADGIQLTGENEKEMKLLGRLAKGCHVYVIKYIIGKSATFRLVEGPTP